MDEDAGEPATAALSEAAVECTRTGHDWRTREVILTMEGADTYSVCTRCGTEGIQGAAGRRKRPELPEIRYVRGELGEDYPASCEDGR